MPFSNQQPEKVAKQKELPYIKVGLKNSLPYVKLCFQTLDVIVLWNKIIPDNHKHLCSFCGNLSTSRYTGIQYSLR